MVFPKFDFESPAVVSPELEKQFQQRREEQEERDVVQKGIFGQLQHLSEVQEQQQKSIDDVAASTAALAKSSERLSPWQKWGTLIIIILSALGVIIVGAVAIRGGFV